MNAALIEPCQNCLFRLSQAPLCRAPGLFVPSHRVPLDAGDVKVRHNFLLSIPRNLWTISIKFAKMSVETKAILERRVIPCSMAIGDPERSPFTFWRSTMAVKRIWTTSRPELWWFTKIMGYRINFRGRETRYNSYGEIYHVPLWLLCPARAVLSSRTVREQR